MHTKDVVAAITDRSRKALEQLEKIWLVSKKWGGLSDQHNLQEIKK